MPTEKNALIYQTQPTVVLATNIFVNVPTILQHRHTPLIQVVKEIGLGFTSQFSVYNSDGLKVATVKGTRVFTTKEGAIARFEIDKRPEVFACTLEGKTLFEIRNEPGDTFKLSAELYTPEGYLVTATPDMAPAILDKNSKSLDLGWFSMSQARIEGFAIGVLIGNNSVSVGAYKYEEKDDIPPQANPSPAQQ